MNPDDNATQSTEEVEVETADEPTELGKVSDTKGGFFGVRGDNGGGYTFE